MSQVELSGVPKTMLWTLHNRANEAARGDGILRDPDAIRIYRAIDYDYTRSFGKPDGSHALRSRVFDDALRPWLAQNPGATVVELAAGLETQFCRVDDGRVRWLCVDVPEALEVRAQFLPPSERCLHLGCSALDPRWIDAVPAGAPLFITAQGLLMYFSPEQVRGLLATIAERLPGAELMFDTIPPWFSRKTLRGWSKTRHFQAPPMPWGIRRSEIASTLQGWSPSLVGAELVSWGYRRHVAGAVLPIFTRIPVLRDLLPAIVRVRVREGSRP